MASFHKINHIRICVKIILTLKQNLAIRWQKANKSSYFEPFLRMPVTYVNTNYKQTISHWYSRISWKTQKVTLVFNN